MNARVQPSVTWGPTVAEGRVGRTADTLAGCGVGMGLWDGGVHEGLGRKPMESQQGGITGWFHSRSSVEQGGWGMILGTVLTLGLDPGFLPPSAPAPGHLLPCFPSVTVSVCLFCNFFLHAASSLLSVPPLHHFLLPLPSCLHLGPQNHRFHAFCICQS